MNLSVLYLTDIPSPYRVSFFNELGLYCNLTVIFERYKSSRREVNWHDYTFDTFRGVFLKGINIAKDSNIDLRVLNILTNQKFDIIVIGNYSTPTGIISINYLKSKKIPFVLSVDGGLIDYEESNFKRNLKTKLISSANVWLSTGEFTNKYLTYYGANQENICVYPFTTMKKENVIDRPLSKREKENKRIKLNISYKNMVLSVGSFISGKGFDVLIKAAKDFREDTGVYIIGGTPTKEYIDLIEKYNLSNVHFIDFLEYSKLKEYYLAADIFVFPTRGDVWGLVINEAMANGLPVITTTSCVAGIEMIEDGINGYLIPKDNVEQVVEKTNYILEDPDLKDKTSENNLIKTEEYTIENMAKTTFKILSRFVKNS